MRSGASDQAVSPAAVVPDAPDPMPRGRPRGSTVLAICAIAVTGLLGAGAAVGSALASPPSTSVPLGLASPPSPDGSARGGASERASAAPLADEAEADRLHTEYLTLQELRKAKELTQVQLAETLGIQQATVAKYERQSDLLLSTLRSYVAAMGGDLKLMVEFPGKAPVALEGLGDTAAA